MNNPFSLEGKTILVTGTSSGIGRATAIECSKLGASLILTGRNEERLLETLSLLHNKDNKHQVYVADLSNSNSLSALVDFVPMLDGCANIAGIGKTLPVQFFSWNELDNLFGVNCFAPMMLTKELLRKKKIVKGASLVYTLSIAGNFNILPGNAIYGCAKTALASFVKYVAVELAGKNIRCNGVSPGMIDTPFIENITSSKENMAKEMELYPLKRFGKPEEVAHAIIYLLSDAASWVTGTNLVIDGGRSLK